MTVDCSAPFSLSAALSACVNWLQITGLGRSLVALVCLSLSHTHPHTHTLAHLSDLFFLMPAANTHLCMFLHQWPTEGRGV